MGLIGGMARTAVVAGTATAVSNRVSRRQAGRWAAQDAYQQQQYQQYQEPQYQQPQYQQPPPPPADDGTDDKITRLTQLGELKSSGVLTEEEFQREKAKILAT
ncbi:MAG: SHOCT domain-containing protein [Marmoricola sp.]|nr:SHOCT domain-containing protein [Marmoricola sp.]